MPAVDSPLFHDTPDEDTRVRIDVTQPSIARAYDAALNGKDNYEVDRELLRRIVNPAGRACGVCR
ncbi:MAG: SAM-dependent methyltransferase [Mycobacterium sp.]